MKVVITGASRGIGAEFVRRYLELGAEVHAVSRNTDRLQPFTTDHPARDGKGLHLHSLSLSEPGSALHLAKTLDGAPVDLLINNAGAYLDHEADFKDLDLDLIRQSFEVNTLLPIRVCQALLVNLSLANGKVINIGSLMGSIDDNSSGGAYGYRISKGALNTFTKSFAIDHTRITSIVMHPGWVQTDMGGKGAPTTIEQSVAGMMKVIAGLKPSHSGMFLDFEGDRIAW